MDIIWHLRAGPVLKVDVADSRIWLVGKESLTFHMCFSLPFISHQQIAARSVMLISSCTDIIFVVFSV